MDNIDKKNRLEQAPFSYRVSKDKKVFLEYEGSTVKILKGQDAEKFLRKVKVANTEKEIQLIIAKITGNFKRGNEGNNTKKW